MTRTVEATAAIVREKGGQFLLEKVRIGPLRPDEVLVRVVAAGVCHTDLSVRDQHAPVPLPAILGHEGAGIIVETGTSVTDLSSGDHVVMTYLSCGRCNECVSAHPASCSLLATICFSPGRPDGSHAVTSEKREPISDQFFGQSSFATYAVANQRNVVKVPTDIPLRLLGPLGCGVMTGAGAVWNELQVYPGSSFLVLGSGSVGLSAILAAKAAGASTIIAVDRLSNRLELAKSLGATVTINASTQVDQVREIRSLTGGGVDFVLDTTGIPAVVRGAIEMLRQRGTLGLVAGWPGQFFEVEPLSLIAGCKRLVGIIEGGGSAHLMIPKMIALYRSGQFAFDKLISFYDFEKINEAVADSQNGVTIKPVLLMSGGDAYG